MTLSIGHHVMSNPEKTFFDAISIVTAVGTMSDLLPHVAALFTIVWTGMRIGETAYGWMRPDKKSDTPKE